MSLFGIQSRLKSTTLMFSLLQALLFICSDQLRAITQLSYLSKNIRDHQKDHHIAITALMFLSPITYSTCHALEHQPRNEGKNEMRL